MKPIFLTHIVFIGFVILFFSCQNQTLDNQDRKQVEITKANLDDMEMIEARGTPQQDHSIIDKDYFKKFDKIELVYYPHSVRSYGTMPACGNLIKNGVFDVDSLEKKKGLSKRQIQKFEDLVFTPLKETDSIFMSADCFKPRHSLVFYEGEKATHIIEVCFECSGICNSSYDSINVNNLYFRFEEMESLFDKILND
ncbi:hypothetical protein ACE193_01250 [Bernardetia sp. OM2101]|uniref:hypothetical protein n=1 Tax=Bernardetia sp. OM2101 TaxID=3344876 RepID=UPI0035D0C08E